jgi:outer membrane beta-barrel protein
MRARLRFAPLALAALMAAGVAVAEPIGSHFELTPFAGYTIFDGKLRYPGSSNPLQDDLYMGGRLGYHFNSWLGLEGAAGFTASQEDPPVASSPRDFDFSHYSGSLVLSPAQGRWGGPYVFVGGGYNLLKPSTGAGKEETGGYEFGGGLKFWLTDELGLRFEARDVSFKPLNDEGGQTNYHNVVLGAGLTFALGGTPRDTDGDGVPDKKDKCPDTPKGARVDATGCPLDSDGDKVFDGLDQCEGTPRGATVDAKGCPSDADGDGVFDGLDTCADTPKGATVDAKGCPSDSDGDGVLDGLDQCANTPKGAKVDDKGCPIDTDGDGVPDGLDECEDTPAGLKVDPKGCPIEVMERETELLDTGMIRLQGVNFETGKADILPESFSTLDAAGAVLSKWTQLKVEVGGHTDSRGGRAKNMTLSKARADSVRAYILRKYPNIDPAQMTSRGYGPTKPVAPNTSPENMAKNRRVEFVVTNKDVLRNEIERRRLLKQGEGAPSDSTKQE